MLTIHKAGRESANLPAMSHIQLLTNSPRYLYLFRAYRDQVKIRETCYEILERLPPCSAIRRGNAYHKYYIVLYQFHRCNMIINSLRKEMVTYELGVHF